MPVTVVLIYGSHQYNDSNIKEYNHYNLSLNEQ